MNTILIKHINDTQKKMGAYLSLLDLRYKNLCVKADPVALLPVTINTGHQEVNIEEVANISMPNEFQLAIYPNISNYMQDIIRGVFEAHPEFKLDVRDTNEDRKNQEKSQMKEPDEEGLEEEPDMNSVLGLDDMFDEDSDETKYLLYTMPEVNKDRHDFLSNGVKALHKQCMARLDAEYAAGLKKFSEVEMYSSEKDMAEARQDLKDILDDVKEKADQKLQEKQQEIEEAYRHFLEQQAEEPVPNNPQEEEQDQPGYDVSKGFRVS